MINIEQLEKLVESKQKQYFLAADRIWDYAETRFELKKSADEFIEILDKENFSIKRSIANMEDAFVATYGQGKPVIGILAEYDALSNMGHIVDSLNKNDVTNENGHGCGHNLLGMGALAGAVGIKDYMQLHNIAGTVKLFGCPAEESGSGKAFMAKEGAFNDLDIALTWHPFHTTKVWGEKTLAVYQVYFKFKGISSHAAASPHLGRSALDAAELMNIGVNFLREHVEDDVRIHYAFLDVGGKSANVVQSSSTLLYFIRAKNAEDLPKIYERVLKVAQGAALMSETELEVIWDSACLNMIPNKALSKVMYEAANSITPLKLCEHLDYRSTLSVNEILTMERELKTYLKADQLLKLKDSSFNPYIAPFLVNNQGYASTDVGDVSWIIPTAHMFIACEPLGTALHSWQWVSNGKSKMAHQGITFAAKTIGLSALKVMSDNTLLEKISQEHKDNLGDRKFKSHIPDSVLPKQNI